MSRPDTNNVSAVLSALFGSIPKVFKYMDNVNKNKILLLNYFNLDNVIRSYVATSSIYKYRTTEFTNIKDLIQELDPRDFIIYIEWRLKNIGNIDLEFDQSQILGFKNYKKLTE